MTQTKLSPSSPFEALELREIERHRILCDLAKRALEGKTTKTDSRIIKEGLSSRSVTDELAMITAQMMVAKARNKL